MNEQAFARRVTAHLSAAARDVDDDISARLRQARERAIAAHRPAHGIAGRFSGSVLRRLFPPVIRSAAMAVAILAVVLSGDYWMTWSRVSTLQDVDTALLIDDLPIDAYLDANFKAWLQQDSHS
ncbi:DUF3619 family protein [Aromatoleum diolicum]|uniref:DUF3619 family protein n=1 Tax=Aromatoleum diolicum TaxID=75796 RepID=A0ABX1QBA1_9RHOO|nr:DUF3619 family protein [Aromatoleum diolicum]NMG75253.1 DUF3619 family protein [Aromatoleum diolicum]